MKNFMAFTKKNNCVPEFLNVHYYSDKISVSSLKDFNSTVNARFSYPKRTDDFSLWIGSIKKIIADMELSDLPLYLTEWNFSLSHRNLVNDTCFKSCYILKNLLRNYDRLDSFGYWSLTDYLHEHSLPENIFHGGLGMFTMNGIPKSVYYSFLFANQLGNELLSSGDGYFVTRKENSLQIITYHYIHYNHLYASGELFDINTTNRYSPFDLSQKHQFHFHFTDMINGEYEIREYYVNRQHGSAYDLWVANGAFPLSNSDTELLKSKAVPEFHIEHRLIDSSEITYDPVLEPLEMRFTELRIID